MKWYFEETRCIFFPNFYNKFCLQVLIGEMIKQKIKLINLIS
jgi:hypothetical protein